MDGFWGHNRPSPDEWGEAYTTGIICLDTNALLDAYRFSPGARGEFLTLLEQLHSRLYVPHQVAAEFHARRVDAVADRRTELDKFRQDALDSAQSSAAIVKRLGQRARAPEDRVTEILTQQKSAADATLKLIDEVIEEYDLRPDSIAGGEDPILPRLIELLNGRVGEPATQAILDEDLKEGEDRRVNKRPPGFRDSATGDYLWWADLLRFTESQGGKEPVLVVTNDVGKGDWTYEKRGIRIGPSLELVREMQDRAGRKLLLTTVHDLLKFSPKYLRESSVSPATVAEAEDLAQSDRRARDAASRSIDSSYADGEFTTSRAARALGIHQRIIEKIAEKLDLGFETLAGRQLNFADLVRIIILNDALVFGASDDDLRDILKSLPARLAALSTRVYFRDGKFTTSSVRNGEILESDGWRSISRSTSAIWRQLARELGQNDQLPLNTDSISTPMRRPNEETVTVAEVRAYVEEHPEASIKDAMTALTSMSRHFDNPSIFIDNGE
jgi:hypothetical protein